MNVSQMLSADPAAHQGEGPRHTHGYPTRRTSYIDVEQGGNDVSSGLNGAAVNQESAAVMAHKKLVTFQLVLPGHAQAARLPLKVYVSPHDTTDSIVSTNRNFYGLYEGQGISFEDERAIPLIARYENFGHNSTVFVRVRDERPPSALGARPMPAASPSPTRKPWLDEPIQLQPVAPLRVASPSKAQKFLNVKASSVPKLRGGESFGDDVANGYSDSDAGSVSVSSSRRAKSDGLATAEISLENIVEGGRRKKPKFESSELPLFVPPSFPMTASMSSASPQRKIMNGQIGSPFQNQTTFPYNNVLPSPQSYGRPEVNYPAAVQQPIGPFTGQRLRQRSSGNLQASRLTGAGVLPTPDPTIGGSVISDEDVALQLMRLGDPTNFSHGRLSNSTLDETLSGKAEATSSAGNSDVDSDLDEYDHPHLSMHGRHGHMNGPPRKKLKGPTSGPRAYSSHESSADEYDDHNDRSFKGDSDELGPYPFNMHAKSKSGMKAPKSRTASVTSKTHPKPRLSTSGKSKAVDQPVPQRKGSGASPSMAQNAFGDDEEDLSSRPRCQRCRKSKKGCDRQRPCGRCKDAGIGIEGCISEDEGNGRKGRYGRHMGVPVKKDSGDSLLSPDLPDQPMMIASPGLSLSADADKLKKRKR